MNNNCEKKLEKSVHHQSEMMSEGNHYVHRQTRASGLPYFDAASVLRTPSLCDVSGDGLHLKMWVDMVRAKILFNHLCDDDMNWVGGVDAFVEKAPHTEHSDTSINRWQAKTQ